MSTAPVAALVLASASPRRLELLRQIGIPFRVRIPEVDETPRPGEREEAYVYRVATAKARHVAGLEKEEGKDELPVLAADTAVVLGKRILGKPRDREHFLEMFARLSGRRHRVLTAVAVARGNLLDARVVETFVTLHRVESDEATCYWNTGEPMDKAGGYGIQGIGGLFVDRIEGSYSAVVGLPLAETEQLLHGFGVNTWCFRDGMQASP